MSNDIADNLSGCLKFKCLAYPQTGSARTRVKDGTRARVKDGTRARVKDGTRARTRIIERGLGLGGQELELRTSTIDSGRECPWHHCTILTYTAPP